MEGVIIKYIDDKGFGFIKDENEQDRFFHINDIKEQHKFKTCFSDYYFYEKFADEYYDDNIYIVDFTPYSNNKGLTAVEIQLSKKIFNDKNCMNIFEALITDLKYDVWGDTTCVSGIKKGQSIPFGATVGGNGTYRIGYPEMHRDLLLHFRKIGGAGWGDIEIRNLALNINNRQKITTNFVDSLKEKIVNKKMEICGNNGNWKIKNTALLKL
jgi:hypothetical protein